MQDKKNENNSTYFDQVIERKKAIAEGFFNTVNKKTMTDINKSSESDSAIFQTKNQIDNKTRKQLIEEREDLLECNNYYQWIGEIAFKNLFLILYKNDESTIHKVDYDEDTDRRISYMLNTYKDFMEWYQLNYTLPKEMNYIY